MVSSLGVPRSRVLEMASGGRLAGCGIGGYVGSGGRGVMGVGGGVGPRPVPAPLPSPKTR